KESPLWICALDSSNQLRIGLYTRLKRLHPLIHQSKMQGKRKSSSKPQGPKRKEKLPTTFQCLFCNHEKSVSVSIEKKSGVGNLQCKVCGQTFQTNINYLSAPVDVYADWIDACDAVAKEAAAGKTATTRATGRMGRVETAREEDEDDVPDADDLRFVEQDDLDAEGEYAE
ncbi:transcription elongation factor 1, partial [Parastagonospora nodorum SN15]